MTEGHPSTADKALAINLDNKRHGTFAEIGAGQEVARWFFHVGGAAGTVAKSVSAYDMKFSDAIYGSAHRYVSRERLLAMLDHEYDLLIERLDAARGAETTFFAFADTVAARSYSRHENTHGWLGLRFQHEPRSPTSQIVLHVNLLDTENVWQQQALGVVGVNLVHGAMYLHEHPNQLVGCLFDSLARERIEIDLLEFSGPAFANVDNRLISLLLVELGFTSAAMFRSDGSVIDPADALYKRAVVAERGDFRPVNRLHEAIMERAKAAFSAELGADEEPLKLFELSLRDLGRHNRADSSDFIARVDALATLGGDVLVSNLEHDYALAEYLVRYTERPVALAMGVPAVEALFDGRYYEKLKGGTLEASGRLFSSQVRVFAYPTRETSGGLVTSNDVKLSPPLDELYAYLLARGSIRSVEPGDPDWLDVKSEQVLERIRAGDPAWEQMVPPSVAAIIKERGFFAAPR